jgi:threonine/homoserine/homoserine lactone efflux protein
VAGLRLATAPPLGAASARTRASTLAGGIALGTLNPKAWVAIDVVFSGSHVAATPAVDAMVKVVLLAGVIVAVHAGWLAAGRLLVPLLQARGRRGWSTGSWRGSWWPSQS